MNKADIEFFYSPLVLRVVKGLLPANTKWDSLSHRSKQNYLDKAVNVLHELINNKQAMGILQRINELSDLIVP